MDDFQTRYIFDDIQSVFTALFSSHQWQFQEYIAVTSDILTSLQTEHTPLTENTRHMTPRMPYEPLM